MKAVLPATAYAVALMLTINGSATAADCAKVSMVAPGVYVREGRDAAVFSAPAVANVGFVVGKRCVAVIDSGGSPAEGTALKCALRQVTNAAICYLINTHVHPDHVLGNRTVRDDETVVIGHFKLPRAMAMLGPFYLQRLAERTGREPDTGDLVLPNQVVEGTRELDLGDRMLRLRAHGSAHTDHDLSVEDPTTGTLWLGDLLFVRHVPVVSGSTRGWLVELGDLARAPARQAVPGHGPAAVPWPDAARDQLRYLQTLRADTGQWLEAGGSLAAAADHVAQEEADRWTLFSEYHGRNVSATYIEMEWED